MKKRPLFKCLFLLFLYPSLTLGGSLDNEFFYQWLLNEYDKRPDLNTNQIIRSDEFSNFLRTNITNKNPVYLGMTMKDEREDFSFHLQQVLGGPPDPIQFDDDGTISISGCRFQSCPEKGFIWIDTKSQNQIFVIVSYFFETKIYNKDGYLVVYSNDFTSIGELPSQFKNSLSLWLKREKLKTNEIKFIR